MARRKPTSQGGGGTAGAPNGGSPATVNDEDKRQPIHRIRMRNVTGAIWQNENEHGPWYSVTMSRSYRDGEGRWHTTESYGGPDLLVLAEVARECFRWIAHATQAQTRGGQGAGQEAGSGEQVPF